MGTKDGALVDARFSIYKKMDKVVKIENKQQ